MKLKLLILVVVGFFFKSNAQEQYLPQDFLKKEFHKERREALRELMPKNSVAVFFANPVRNRANDVEYVYHQDPNFYYLSGYREPHALLLVFKENQNIEGKDVNEALFVQERNEYAEMWTGKRLGVKGAQDDLGFRVAFNGSEFSSSSIDFSKFDKICSSVSVSTADKQSSNINILGFLITALAILKRCFCPPESVTPRSPKMVSYWFLKSIILS